MMVLQVVEMVNFMPFKGCHKLEIAASEMQNVTLVFGDNMRGKTSILNAVRWVFYGVAMGRHSKPIPLWQLPNKEAGLEGDWRMEVRVKFIADGATYDLRRQALKKAHIACPERDEDYDVHVNMMKDGMPVAAHHIPTEINRYIPEQVSRFFLFDGELLQEYESLLVEGDEQGRQIKESIEKVLGVPALINGRDYAGVLLKKMQKVQNQDMKQFAAAASLIDSRKVKQERIDIIEKDLVQLKARSLRTRQQREELDDCLEKVEAIYSAKANADALEKELKRCSEEHDVVAEKKRSLVSSSWKVLASRVVLQRLNDLQGQEKEIAVRIDKRQAVKLEIEQLKRILSYSECPTCRQPVDGAYRNSAGERLGFLEGGVPDSQDEEEINEIRSEIRNLNRLISKSPIDELRKCTSDIQGLDLRSIRIEGEIERLRQEVKGYDTAEIMRWRANRDVLIKEEARIEEAISNSDADRAKLLKDLRQIDVSINALPQANDVKSSKYVQYFSVLERVFSDSVERLRENLRTRVESAASEAFKKLTTQKMYSGLKINNNYGLAILDEKMSVVGIRSAGAEQIVALSLIDGLGRTGRSAGPIVMDTPFGRLDTKHRDNILAYLPTTARQLVLLVHDGEIKSRADLAQISHRIGAEYTIHHIGPRHSEIREA